MFWNFFLIVFRGLRYRPVRSWLTVLGIIIGIMLVVIILALGNGISYAVKSTLQQFGSDIIIIFPGKETNPLLGLVGNARFRTKDLEDLATIDGVKFSMPVDSGIVTVESKGEKQSMLLHAQNWKHYIEILEQSQGTRLEVGRYPANDTAKEVLLGYKAAHSIFLQPIRVGDEITIKGKKFKVVGIMSQMGEQNHDSVIFISYDTFRDLTGGADTAFSSVVKVKPGYDIKVIAQEIRYRLSKQSVVEDFTVLTPDNANNLVDNVLNIIEVSLMIIALVSLVVGGVGIMNTMYTSVLERTRQIGVMKAIGATYEAILALFLIESGMIGAIGGFFGIVLGLLAAYGIGGITENLGVRGLFSWVSVDYFGLFALLVFAFIVGIVAGFFPARTGARLEPAEALRYE